MASLLLVAHAPLASSLLAVAQHTFPECGQRLHAVDVDPSATLPETTQRVRAELATLPEGEVLILADVFGATPCNAALAAIDDARTRVVSGVSVPMLWRTLCYAELPLEDLVARAVAGAAQGAMHVAVPRRQNQSTAAASHAPVQHHDQ